MPSDAEIWKARLAELHQKAAEVTDPVTKDEYLSLAQCWDEALRDIEANEGRNTGTPR